MARTCTAFGIARSPRPPALLIFALGCALGLSAACATDSASGDTTPGSAGSDTGGVGATAGTAGTAAGGKGSGAAGAGAGGSGGTGNGGTSNGGSNNSGGVAGRHEDGAPCGWENQGRVLSVTADIEVCLPPTICNNEVCPADLGTCVPEGIGGECVFHEGYDGLKTLPEAWTSWYCDLDTGCLGTLEGTTHHIRDEVQANLGIPACYEDSSGTCFGITAFSPMLGGNSRLAKNASGGALAEWGLGLTPASGLCYELEGSTGKKAIVAVTDRCAGYCACDDARTEFQECGNCLLTVGQDPDAVTPSCPCVGNNDAMGAEGQACAGQQTCDWCMSNNHPHFDLDRHTFNHVCDAEATRGSCKLARVSIVDCMQPTKWPCDPGTWFCFGDSPAGRIPGTYCCE